MIEIHLNNDEALVLFDFLSRETKNLKTEHFSEEKVLNNILATLEKTLPEPFAENYKELLSQAREKVQ